MLSNLSRCLARQKAIDLSLGAQLPAVNHRQQVAGEPFQRPAALLHAVNKPFIFGRHDTRAEARRLK